MGKHIHKLSNIDPINRKADCSHCGRVSIKKIKNRSWRCRVAFTKHQKNTSIGYGYRTGSCEVCGEFSEKLVQDHNHKTLELRGWICAKCNFVIGMIEAGREIDKIGKYLEHHRTNGSGKFLSR